MNTRLISLITKVVKLIFQPELLALTKELDNLYKEQYVLTGSCNFIYKGKSYINSNHKDLPIKPISKDLVSRLSKYIQSIADLDINMSKVSNYLNYNSPKRNGDIYFLLPECCHYLLELYLTHSEASLTEKPDQYDDIKELIEQSLLLRLIE